MREQAAKADAPPQGLEFERELASCIAESRAETTWLCRVRMNDSDLRSGSSF